MLRKIMCLMLLLIGISILTACSTVQDPPAPKANIANPASTYCEQNGGKLELRQDPAGGAVGICVFPDKSECEEWAYFRQECKPGDSLAKPLPTVSPIVSDVSPSDAAEIAIDGWRIYKNEQVGLSFQYPPNATLQTADDPFKSLTIIGPLEGGDNWPNISISFPRDRAEYRLPEGADLLQWLTDHNLLSDKRQPDVRIAGITAVHLRFDRSPQSYAYDRYYFSRSGQLYMVLIGHTGDKEDWDLYNQFLASIQFTP